MSSTLEDWNSATPILSEDLIFSENDKELQMKRACRFDQLVSAVESLQKFEGSNNVTLIWQGDKEISHTGVIPINSLLFQTHERMEYILVILASSNRVDITKLQTHLERDNFHARISNSQVTCSMVEADQVEQHCGFPPMSVPPFGHSPRNIRTIVDASLVSSSSKTILVGGGGHPRIGCWVASDTLLKLEWTELAQISTTSDDAPPLASEYSSNSLPLKPFFPLPPPDSSQVKELLSNPDRPNPLTPTPITLVGRINGIRRMAKRLVFVDLAPPDYAGTGTKLDSLDLPWKSAIDGQHMAVQLIAGKTFCKNRSDGAEALKQLKVGQLILVNGKTNVGNRESLGHWLNKRSMDLVVIDYQLLDNDRPGNLHSTTIPQPMANAKRTRRAESTLDQNGRSIDYLKFSDIFESGGQVKYVNGVESIHDFGKDLESVIDQINGEVTPVLTGIDCEWKPSFLLESPDEPQPVLLLQVCIQALETVYLFDLQSLFTPCLSPLDEPNSIEALLSSHFETLFGSSRFLKVGFQLSGDLKRLVSSYPHISAFRRIEAVTDVSVVASKVLLGRSRKTQRKARQPANSLSNLSKHLLQIPIRKQAQTSDWSTRPLSQEQLNYAALDAAVLPLLFDSVIKLAGASWYDGSFSVSILSFRHSFLEHDDPSTIRKHCAKKLVSDYHVVTKSCQTNVEATDLRLAQTRRKI